MLMKETFHFNQMGKKPPASIGGGVCHKKKIKKKGGSKMEMLILGYIVGVIGGVIATVVAMAGIEDEEPEDFAVKYRPDNKE